MRAAVFYPSAQREQCESNGFKSSSFPSAVCFCLEIILVCAHAQCESTKTLKFSLNFADKLKYGEPN